MESNRGAEPATLVPPVSLATQIPNERQGSTNTVWLAMAFKVAETEVTRDLGTGLVLPDDENDEDIREEIDATFQRKLTAIRRLPKRERADARRAAMEERATALLALRQKREATRQFRRFLLRLFAPKPEA
jgi:hypothetical protein